MFEESNKILEDVRRHRYMAHSEQMKATAAEKLYIPALVNDAKCLEGGWFVTNDAEFGHIKFYHCLKIIPCKTIPLDSGTTNNYLTDRLTIVYDTIGVYGHVWHGKHYGKIALCELRNAKQMTWEDIKKKYNVLEENSVC